MAHCKECGRSLTKDEIALHKKIYNRGAEEFFLHRLQQPVPECTGGAAAGEDCGV